MLRLHSTHMLSQSLEGKNSQGHKIAIISEVMEGEKKAD